MVTSAEVPMDESSLVATATAEVQTKALVATITTTEVPMDESSLVATAAEVQMQPIEPITARRCRL